MNVTMSEQENNDFFFWLGEDGNSFELSQDEFNFQVEKARKRKQDYLNVNIGEDIPEGRDH